MVIANSPVQATMVQYSSDMRIKRDINSVDENALLQKIMKQFKTKPKEKHQCCLQPWASIQQT